MPILNITIPDSSPVITYNGLWRDSDRFDPLANSYVDGTFHATQEQSATASFKFNGTAVYLFGAFRPNHDQYSVLLDGQAFLGNSSANVDTFDRLMFARDGLAFGEHTVVFENAYTTESPSFVDLDYAIVTAGDGQNDTVHVDVTMDDGPCTNITYSDGWTSDSNEFSPAYYNQTMHRTNVPNAEVTIRFYGNAVTLYGATSTNHGPFSVSLDNGPPSTLNGTAPLFRPQTLLYLASGLPTSDHTVTLTNLGDTFLDLDRVVVSLHIARPSDASPVSAASAPPQAPIAAIVGGVLGVAILLILSGFTFFLWWRRRYMGARPRSLDLLGSPPSATSDGGGLAPSKPEMDMPPPEYAQVFRPPGVSAVLTVAIPSSPVPWIPPQSSREKGSPSTTLSPVQMQNAYSPLTTGGSSKSSAGLLSPNGFAMRKEDWKGRLLTREMGGANGGIERKNSSGMGGEGRVGLPARPGPSPIPQDDRDGGSTTGSAESDNGTKVRLGRGKTVRFA